MLRLAGKAIIVTGAGSGIGAACARRIAAEGAAVMLTDIRGEAAESVAAKIRAGGGNAAAMAHDIADEPGWADLFAATRARFGKADHLLNNAGIGGKVCPVAQQSLADWRQMFTINLDGTFLGIRTALGGLESNGSIVNIASLGAYVSQPGNAAYCASKAAIVSLTKTAAKEAATMPARIRVNAILPGFVATDSAKTIVAQHFGECEESLVRFAGQLPLGGGEPQDIAGVVAFLMSADARWVTGAAFVIDGGMNP